MSLTESHAHLIHVDNPVLGAHQYSAGPVAATIDGDQLVAIRIDFLAVLPCDVVQAQVELVEHDVLRHLAIIGTQIDIVELREIDLLKEREREREREPSTYGRG